MKTWGYWKFATKNLEPEKKLATRQNIYERDQWFHRRSFYFWKQIKCYQYQGRITSTRLHRDRRCPGLGNQWHRLRTAESARAWLCPDGRADWARPDGPLGRPSPASESPGIRGRTRATQRRQWGTKRGQKQPPFTTPGAQPSQPFSPFYVKTENKKGTIRALIGWKENRLGNENRVSSESERIVRAPEDPEAIIEVSNDRRSQLIKRNFDKDGIFFLWDGNVLLFFFPAMEPRGIFQFSSLVCPHCTSIVACVHSRAPQNYISKK